MSGPRLPGLLCGLLGEVLELEASPEVVEPEPEDAEEDEARVDVAEDLDDEQPVEAAPARRPKRSEQYDGQIVKARDALVVELGRTPTNREIAARVDWGRDVRPQTQSERVRLALVRLGGPRNRKRRWRPIFLTGGDQ